MFSVLYSQYSVGGRLAHLSQRHSIVTAFSLEYRFCLRLRGARLAISSPERSLKGRLKDLEEVADIGVHRGVRGQGKWTGGHAGQARYPHPDFAVLV